jgi:hypothetical protein
MIPPDSGVPSAPQIAIAVISHAVTPACRHVDPGETIGVRHKMTPGMKPASAMPSKNRSI